MAKEKKQRADKYEDKVAVNGTFEGFIKIAVTEKSKPKCKIKA